jgi:biotin transport system substrate-specific component
VFAAGGGIAYFAGPTGGYLVGFFVAAVAVGWLAEHGWDRSPLRTLAAMLIGTAIIFALGLAWLGTLIGLPQAIGAGLVPFLPGEAVKIALATAILPFAWRLVHRG